MIMSYESLSSQEREMFLDVAICFHDKDLEPVKLAWEQCGWAATMMLGLNNLERKGLVTIEKVKSIKKATEPEEIIRIEMHEVLRDLGRSLACPKDQKVSTHSRVCFDVSNPLPTAWAFIEENPKVKVLVISSGEMGRPYVTIQELHRLKDLKVLWLDGVFLSGPCDLLPRELANMRISYSEWSDTPDVGFPKLSLVSCLIRGSPRDSGKSGSKHVKLRHVEIVNCQKLDGFSNHLGCLQALEDLRILSCVCLDASANALGQLRVLKHLEIMSHDWKALVDILEALPDLAKLVIHECINHGYLRAEEIALFVASLVRRGLLQSFGRVKFQSPNFMEVKLPLPTEQTMRATGAAMLFLQK
ncbi:unnamed protein product [Calypogeia fissa]